MSKHSKDPGLASKDNPGQEKDKVPEKQAETLQSNSGMVSEEAGENPQEKEQPAVDEAAQTTDQKAEKTPEERIAELEASLVEANDQYLRKAADFENFRKRMNREKQEAIEYANQSLLLDLIQTMDDFERALKAAESKAAGEFSAFYEGVSMIEKRLSTQLENKWGLKRFSSTGQAFDPNLHEALQMEKSPDISEAIVQEEYYKGYTLKDRVIRSAKVKVLVPGTEAAPEKNEDE